MKISAVVAMSENGVIGDKNNLPWHLPEDLKNFRSITMGKPILMGRKTFESLGRPLPGRDNIILTRNNSFTADGCFVFHTIEDTLTSLIDVPEIMIIGGASVYHQTLPLVTRLYLTLLHDNYKGDTLFPDYSEPEWTTIENRQYSRTANSPPFSIKVLERL